MDLRLLHHNHNVTDLGASLAFYETALGFHEKRRISPPDGSFVIVFLGSSENDFELELTWLRDHPQPYDLGECEFHLGIGVAREEFETLHQMHKDMGCICFENPEMGVYFIEDPDSFWIELLPMK